MIQGTIFGSSLRELPAQGPKCQRQRAGSQSCDHCDSQYTYRTLCLFWPAITTPSRENIVLWSYLMRYQSSYPAIHMLDINITDRKLLKNLSKGVTIPDEASINESSLNLNTSRASNSLLHRIMEKKNNTVSWLQVLESADKKTWLIQMWTFC